MSLPENLWRDIPAIKDLICSCFLLKPPSNKCWWFTKWLYAGHHFAGSWKPPSQGWFQATGSCSNMAAAIIVPVIWNVLPSEMSQGHPQIIHEKVPLNTALKFLSLWLPPAGPQSDLERPQNMNLLPLPHSCPINIWRKLPYLSRFSKQPDSMLLLQFYHF